MISSSRSSARYLNSGDNIYQAIFPLNTQIKKGDYISGENEVYIVSYTPFKEINCIKSQLHLCNFKLSFFRLKHERLDLDGNVIEPRGVSYICCEIPSFVMRNSNLTFNTKLKSPGLFPVNSVTVGLQFNEYTADIEIGDFFLIKDVQYVVTDIEFSSLNSSLSDGLFFIFAKKSSGAL